LIFLFIGGRGHLLGIKVGDRCIDVSIYLYIFF
jgi:hypothetical protein